MKDDDFASLVAAEFFVLADVMIFAIDTPSPATIVLYGIGSAENSAFSVALSKLRLRGYT